MVFWNFLADQGWMSILVASGIVLLFFIFRFYNNNYFQNIGIPSARSYPIVGSALSLITRRKSIFNFLQDIYNEFKDTNACGFYLFISPIIIIRDLELIKQITVKDFDYFMDHRGFILDSPDSLFGKSLFNLKGQRWRDMRNTLSPAFTSSKIKAMFSLTSKVADQLNNHIDKLIVDYESKGEILQVDMRDLFTRFANDVIATSAFGISCDSLSDPDNEFFRMGRDASNFASENLLKSNLFMLAPKLMRALKIEFFPEKISSFFRRIVKDAVDVREAQGIIRPDMIHLLMQARKGTLTSEDDGDDTQSTRKSKLDMSLDDMTSQAFLFFAAGFDTMATALLFLTHQISVRPEVQIRLQEEIDESMNQTGGEITYDAVQNMKYLDMVLNESFRRYPPAGLIDREATKSYLVEGQGKYPDFVIDKGQAVWIPYQAIQNDPQHFPNPEKFDPERFNEENKHKIKPFSYQPFGVGPRNCIGMRFALMEVKLAVIAMLSRFNFVVVPKTPPPKLEYSKSKFSITVDGGFWLGFEKRQKN